MTVTASRLRQNIYRLLDGVAESGIPLTIKRKGTTLKIVHEGPKADPFSRLKKRQILTGDPESIVHMDWSSEWRKQSF